MKLALENQSPWPVQTLPARQFPITEPSPILANQHEIVVVVRPFDPLLNYWAPWKQAMLDWGKPPGGTIDIVTEAKGKTEAEWSIEIIDSLVKDSEGKVVEARLTVLYFFLEWCCMAAVCGRPEKLAAERGQALDLLCSGRPDWSGDGVAAIAQLYE